MPPFWPFKRAKKNEEAIDETPPAPIVYRKGQDVHTTKHSTSQERDESAYKDALALFGDGETTVVASSNIAEEYDGVSNEPIPDTPSRRLNAKVEVLYVLNSNLTGLKVRFQPSVALA